MKSKYLAKNKKFSFFEVEKENKENKEINQNLLGNKRYRCNKLKDNNIDSKNSNKIIAINDILDIVCNLPGITIKALRKMLLVNSKNFIVEKNIIIYMINLRLIYAQDFDPKNNEVVDDTKLFPYSEINLFI